MSATLALQQCPLVRITLGKNVFLQCEIRTNLTQKISGYLTIILAGLPGTSIAVEPFECDALNLETEWLTNY